MDAEDVEMGEWYRRGGYGTDEFTPLSLHCDSFTEMAFRERKSGEIFLFSVFEMEPVPEPVVYPEAWVVVDRASHWWFVCGSLAAAEGAASDVAVVEPLGILHIRTDGSTEMLEIKS